MKKLLSPLSRVLTLAAVVLFTGACATSTVDSENQKKSPKEVAQLYTNLGTQAFLRGDHSQAITDLRKALELDEKNAIAHNHLGLSYYAMGQKADAKMEIERALEIDPNYSDAHINLGNFAVEENKYLVAKQEYQKALNNLEYRFRHRALTNLGHLAVRERNFDLARQYLYQSLAINPDYCMTHFLLGTVFTNEGNSTRAADEFAKSVKSTCTNNLEGHYQLGLAYLKSKQFDKARSQFVFLIEQHPETVQAQQAGEKLKVIP